LSLGGLIAGLFNVLKAVGNVKNLTP